MTTRHMQWRLLVLAFHIRFNCLFYADACVRVSVWLLAIIWLSAMRARPVPHSQNARTLRQTDRQTTVAAATAAAAAAPATREIKMKCEMLTSTSIEMARVLYVHILSTRVSLSLSVALARLLCRMCHLTIYYYYFCCCFFFIIFTAGWRFSLMLRLRRNKQSLKYPHKIFMTFYFVDVMYCYWSISFRFVFFSTSLL